jgi:1-deoxy-D-xylulose-5-phosphate reductoisomerase
MKRIVILGSTGSIGESALRVVEALPRRFRVVGLAAQRNTARLLEQARRFKVRTVAVSDPAAASAGAARLRGLTVLAGAEGLEQLAALEEADLVLCAVVGLSGLKPVVAALRRGACVALATKEVLVAAGDLVMRLSRQRGGRILPVDSEHSAIFQCLQGQAPDTVRRLVLTASGGPFAHRPDIDFDKVSVTEALKHPRWNMGRKVTVDSATLMNKGLEIIEAHWLFGIPQDRIEVVIHPESIVHSLVEFADGAMLAQLSPPDMRYAIQYALTWPERVDGRLPALDLATAGPLHFKAPDTRRFPALALARRAAAAGGTFPAVLNAANEVAVRQFLEHRIPFAGIWRTVEAVLAQHRSAAQPGLETVLEADGWARALAEHINRQK